MGRVLMYTVLAVLAGFVLAATFLLEHEGGPTEAAAQVSVHDLSTAPAAHAHHRVSTEGVLRFEEDDNQFVVTADGLAIVVRSYSVDQLRQLEGRRVLVSGRFDFDAANGVYIDADAVRPLP